MSRRVRWVEEFVGREKIELGRMVEGVECSVWDWTGERHGWTDEWKGPY